VLRCLLGARTFLRLESSAVARRTSTSARPARPATFAPDGELFGVLYRAHPDGIKSSCPCPAFAKASMHCKHVAALLIAVRDQARGSQPRRDPPPPAMAPQSSSGVDSSKRSRRRDRRNRALPTGSSSSMAAMGPPGSTVGPAVSSPHDRGLSPPHGMGGLASLPNAASSARELPPIPTGPNLAAIAHDASAKATGIGAWLPPDGVPGPRKLESASTCVRRAHGHCARRRSAHADPAVGGALVASRLPDQRSQRAPPLAPARER
jgi:hypothetical protein